ncbi:MAG: acyl--CoA ligase [Christensenellaceae bacterium]|nr:acyl--CoA ligase [Christensenellaceae bacterium]
MNHNEYKNMSLYEAFIKGMQSNDGTPCFVYMDKSYSYDYVLNEIEKVAFLLVKHGIKFGDIITVALPNIPQIEYIIYGANKIGAIVHLIHPQVTKEQLISCITKTESKFVFMLDILALGFSKEFTNINAKLFTIKQLDVQNIDKGYTQNYGSENAIDFDKEILTTAKFDTVSFNPRNSRITTFMFNGSGTNGISNIIEMSDCAINSVVGYIFDSIGATNSDKKYNTSAFLPLFHSMGFICMHVVNMRGQLHVISSRFDVDEIIHYIEREQIKVIVGPPIVFKRLLDHTKFTGKTLQNLTVSFVSSDLVPHNLIDAYDARMIENNSDNRLCQCYGLSETVSGTCFNSLYDNKHYTCGRPTPAAQYRIYDETLNLLKENGIGELYIAGDCLCNGYYKSDKANSECFYYADDGKRYVKTGDIMEIDSEGYVSFISRKKRVIKVLGYSVFPSEIEQVAMNVDGINKACAIAIPDERLGSRVVLYYEATKDSPEILSALQIECKKHLMPQSIPKEYKYIDCIPLTMLSKTDAIALKKIYDQEYSRGIDK